MLWLLVNVKTADICIRRFNAMPSKLAPSASMLLCFDYCGKYSQGHISF